MHLSKGLGGFLWVSLDITTRTGEVCIVIKFGVNEIKTYINSDLVSRQPKTKPQDDYTVTDIFELVDKAKVWASVRHGPIIGCYA